MTPEQQVRRLRAERAKLQRQITEAERELETYRLALKPRAELPKPAIAIPGALVLLGIAYLLLRRKSESQKS